MLFLPGHLEETNLASRRPGQHLQPKHIAFHKIRLAASNNNKAAALITIITHCKAIACKPGRYAMERLPCPHSGGFISGKNCSDRVKSVTDWVISVSDFALSVTDFTQTAAEFTLSVADITQTVAEFTLSVTDFTQTVTEITLSVTDRVISVADLTQSVTDFTQTAADLTLSVTDLTLSDRDFSPFLNSAHKTRRQQNTKSEMPARLRPTLARQEAGNNIIPLLTRIPLAAKERKGRKEF